MALFVYFKKKSPFKSKKFTLLYCINRIILIEYYIIVIHFRKGGKYMEFKKIGAVAVALSLLLLTACSSSKGNESENGDNKGNDSSITMPVPGGDNKSEYDKPSTNPDNTAPENSENTKPVDVQTPVSVPEFRNKLTGLETTQ